MAERLRLLAVDDHEVVRWGFRLLLADQPWVERCLTAGSADEALELAARYRPHVAVIDLFMGDASGAELCSTLRERHPAIKVLLISGAGWLSPTAARAAGASGFIPKDWDAEDVMSAVRMVANGMTVFVPREERPAAGLTARERQIVELMSHGSTNNEIAGALHLSPHTVKDHASAVYRKLGVRNRAEAVRRAERLGLTA
ncbi:MAG TPA: response regulator transcription factor [Thermoleophilaceae bacterium]|nr:response regulator transcription factor [Thermoleophilaceae bacterium]